MCVYVTTVKHQLVLKLYNHKYIYIYIYIYKVIRKTPKYEKIIKDDNTKFSIIIK